MKKIRYKILLPFLITSSVFIILSGAYSIVNLIQLDRTEITVIEKLLLDDYDKMIKNEVETAVYVLTTYYDSYKEGKMTEKEAQETARRVIKKLRYDAEGYFWIDDTNGILIAHPMLPEQEGSNRSSIKDPQGVELIKEVIGAARDNKNGGYTNFMWEKPQEVGTGKSSPKRAYSQLFTPWNWVVSTGNYVDNIHSMVEAKNRELNDNLKKNIIAIAIFTLASLIVIAIVSLLVSRKISDPVIRLVKAFEKDERGQISIQEIKLRANDEIGLLANTLNEMSVQVKGFIHGVIQEAGNVSGAADTVEANMSQLNGQILEISATTEEISAGMEETAASSEEMNAVATEMAASVASMANKAQEAGVSVTEISKRADGMKSNLTSTIESGTTILLQARENLNHAVEESKAVTQINELADAILQITSQTNLLALNAAIEAARAGEAGKGFAVVADEIRKLAEDSKNTAGRIQSIIKTVTGAVDNLSDNAMKVLEFTENNVRNDYDFMLKASEAYDTDAKNLEVLVSDFRSTTENLYDSVQNVTKAIDEITSATNEGAESTNNIAQRITLVTGKSNELLVQANKSKQYSENLMGLISKFKL